MTVKTKTFQLAMAAFDEPYAICDPNIIENISFTICKNQRQNTLVMNEKCRGSVLLIWPMNLLEVVENERNREKTSKVRIEDVRDQNFYPIHLPAGFLLNFIVYLAVLYYGALRCLFLEKASCNPCMTDF